jgi:NitT/TauT family transport system substrate-binding protein
MTHGRLEGWTRREFLGTAALAGATTLLGLETEAAAAEPPPETTTIRLTRVSALCLAPQFLAEELLRAEGFTDVQYVKTAPGGIEKALASGEADVSMGVTINFIRYVDAGSPILLLTGVHVGCYELFGTGSVRSVHDLKGKTVSVPGLGSGAHALLASMAAYVGLDPGKDINWLTHPFVDSMRLLSEGKIDGFIGFPPEPQELRAKKIGHVILNSMMDMPWSQYFCCMVAANQEFMRKNPVATKRALRAFLKATDIVAREPERVARFLVDKGYTKNYDYALQGLQDIPYNKWREYDPADTLRFYALRLRDAAMVKSSPDQIIAQGADWRFLNELKAELKG